MKNRIIKQVCLLALTAVVLILVIIPTTLGWYTNAKDISDVNLSITKIDSQIYLYEGYDANYNGIPDLITSHPEADQIIKDNQYPEETYYEEKRLFKYISNAFAMSTESSTENNFDLNLRNVLPSQIRTYKYAVINRSDVDNYLSFSFYDENYAAQTQRDLLSTLSVRVGKVVVVDGALTVDFSPKAYFCDFMIDAGSRSFTIDLNIEDSTEFATVIPGMISSGLTTDNCVDFWFQFEMEPLSELKKHDSDFSMSEEVYQGLQNKTVVLPKLKLTLEVRVSD